MRAETGPSGEVFNIGRGVEVTVLDLIEGLGFSAAPEFAPARAGELQRSCLDPSKAKRLLGWEAKMDLARGLRLTYETVVASREAPEARPQGFLDVG
jgi:UDP-glucose 4-epimerase